jgi:hypothetical protein
MTQVYITVEELSDLIRYEVRSNREQLKDPALFEWMHFIGLFGGPEILYDWEVIKKDMCNFSATAMEMPMARGSITND